MRQSSQTKTRLVEVFPKGREGLSSLPKEHCLTLCLIFGCETLCQDSQEGVDVQGESGAEWTKKGEIPGLYFLLNDIHAVKWVLKYRLYGPAVNLWPSIYKWAKMINQDLEEICIFQV